MGDATGSNSIALGRAPWDEPEPAPVLAPAADRLEAVTPPWRLPDDFWNARPALGGIWDAAKAGMLSPDTVFGSVLLQVISHNGPGVVLPPIVGLSHGSLNMVLAVVGPSAAGKSTSLRAGRVLAPGSAAGEPRSLGTGEGIAALFYDDYGHGRNTERKRSRFRLAFESTEVDELTALMKRQGATLSPVLRKLYGAEEIGHANAAKDRRNQVAADSYRAVVSIGVQPEHATDLLAGSAATSGFAQRILWLDASIPWTELPTTTDTAWAGTEPLVTLPAAQNADEEAALELGRSNTQPIEVVIEIPEYIQRQVRQHRLEQGNGTGDRLEGHSMFTRTKVAAGLALMDGRYSVTDEDWHLSGLVMATSRAMRDKVNQTLQAQKTREMHAAGRRRAITDEAAANVAVEQCAQVLANHVHRKHAEDSDTGPCKAKCQRDAVRQACRPDRSAVLEHAIRRGWVALAPGADEGQKWLVPGESRPRR